MFKQIKTIVIDEVSQMTEIATVAAVGELLTTVVEK